MVNRKKSSQKATVNDGQSNDVPIESNNQRTSSIANNIPSDEIKQEDDIKEDPLSVGEIVDVPAYRNATHAPNLNDDDGEWDFSSLDETKVEVKNECEDKKEEDPKKNADSGDEAMGNQPDQPMRDEVDFMAPAFDTHNTQNRNGNEMDMTGAGSSGTSQKRQSEENDEQNPKRQRQDASNDSHEADELMSAVPSGSSESENTTKESNQQKRDSINSQNGIEEMENTKAVEPFDSLDENSVDIINLPLDKLLTLAESSYQRKKIIETAFAQKYGSEWVHFFADLDCKKWKKILRFFGHMITKLEIIYYASDVKNCIELDRCVNEYCADSLIELIIVDAPRYIMNNFEKPFSKIEIIKFEGCHLAKNSTDFNRWFPMMRSLVISGGNKLVDNKCIEAHFAHLNDLDIRIDSTERFTKTNVAEALRMNPNIRRLRIDTDADFLRDMSQHLQLLEILEIEWSKPRSKNFPIIHFKNVKTLIINTSNKYFNNDSQPRRKTFPFSFDQLKELTFTTDNYELPWDLFKFISNQPSLDKFTLNCTFFDSSDFDNSDFDQYDLDLSPGSPFEMIGYQVWQLAKACTNLTEININNYIFPIEEVVRFFESRSLKQFRFRPYPCEVKEFMEMNKFDGEWHASSIVGLYDDYIKMKRVIGVEIQAQVTEDNKKTEIGVESSESDHEESDYEESDDSISETSSVAATDWIDNNFENMSLGKLLQAAESNAQRKLTIDAVVLTKYQVKTVNFSLSHNQPIEYQNDIIFIGDTETCLSFLHCFGHLIKKISLDSDDDQLLGHLNEYCADSLIELNISRTKNKEFHSFKKPFSNVEVLEFRNCVLSRQLTDFNTWFPQIRRLMFFDQIELDSDCINIQFRHLEDLSIDVQTKMEDELVFGVKNMKMALRLNPQLRSMAFYNVDAKYLHSVRKHLQLLETLYIKWHKDFRYSDLDEQNIHFKSVKKLEVNFHPDDNNAQGIPLSFDRLKTFKLVAMRLNKNSIDFISKHSTITELSLSFKEENHDIDLFHCVKALPSLEIFNLAKNISYV